MACLPLFFLAGFHTVAAEANREPAGLNQPVNQIVKDKNNSRIKATYTITGVKETRHLGDGIFLKRPEGKFVIVKFKVKNISSMPFPADALSNIMLIDGKKRQWKQSVSATGSLRLGTEGFTMMEIGSRMEIEDVVVFDIPENVKDYYIVLPGGGTVSALKQPKAAGDQKNENKSIAASGAGTRHGRIGDANKALDSAWESYKKGDYSAMKEMAENALITAKNSGYERGMFVGYYYLALYYVNVKDYHKAIDFGLRAQELGEKMRDGIKSSIVYKLMGRVFEQGGMYKNALVSYEKYLTSIKNIIANEDRAGASVDVFKDTFGSYEDSLMAGFESGAGKRFIAKGHMSVCRIRKKLGEHESAIKSAVDAVNAFKESGDVSGELFAWWETAEIHALKHEYGEAIKALEDNMDRAEMFGIKRNFINDLIIYAQKSNDRARVEKYKRMKNE
ncbi:MAG: DUF4352 domain-containing protein [Nitrospirae bacterium]|nr:DUF4352 domain-containing protein [Nitrospirota bacterium]